MDPKQTPESRAPGDCLLNNDAVETQVIGSLIHPRFRAIHLFQRSQGVVQAESTEDHALIYHLGGGPGYRHDGSRRLAQTDPAGPATVLPANQMTDWDLSSGVELLQLPVNDLQLRRQARQEFDIDPDRLELREHVGVVDPFIGDLAPIILRELDTDQPDNPLLLEGLMAMISGHILRAYSNISEIVVTRRDAQRDQLNQVAVQRVCEILLDNLDKNITAHELGELIGISPFRLMRAFRAEMGTSIHRFVLENRVAVVRDRLIHTDDELIDIALATGFANQSHMTAAYTRIMGIPPGRHRSILRS